MLRLVVSHLRFRGSGPVALGLGILVAAVAFTLLTAATRTSALRVEGTVEGGHRAAYDVLVRPRAGDRVLRVAAAAEPDPAA